MRLCTTLVLVYQMIFHVYAAHASRVLDSSEDGFNSSLAFEFKLNSHIYCHTTNEPHQTGSQVKPTFHVVSVQPKRTEPNRQTNQSSFESHQTHLSSTQPKTIKTFQFKHLSINTDSGLGEEAGLYTSISFLTK